MYDGDQLVEIRWNNGTKAYFESLGYNFTKANDKFFVKASELHKTSSAKIYAYCDYCGKELYISKRKYYDNSDGYTQKFSCGDKECTNKKVYEYRNKETRENGYNEFISILDKLEYVPLFKLDDYKNCHTKMPYLCKKHGHQFITLSNLKNGQKCKKCSNEEQSSKMRRSIEDVIKIIESKNNNKIINPQDYINTKCNNLQIKCGSCGNVFVTSLSSLMNSEGMCKHCADIHVSNINRLSPDEVSNIVNSINNNILLNSEEYINNNTVNLKIRCSCGKIFVTSLANYIYSNTNRCRTCTRKTSKGELLISNILDDLNIKYEVEKTFEKCVDKRKLPFDFYLTDYNACVEFDGQLHYENKYGQLEYTKKHDEIKNNFCKNNNIKLIRIPYWKSNNARSIIETEIKV